MVITCDISNQGEAVRISRINEIKLFKIQPKLFTVNHHQGCNEKILNSCFISFILNFKMANLLNLNQPDEFVDGNAF